MMNDVILHFKDGQKLEVSLALPFLGNENELKIMTEEAGEQSIFLDELSVILFPDGSCPVNVECSDQNLEDVVTFDNTNYLVYAEAEAKFPNGFYAVPAEKNILWGFAFFFFNGIKMRNHKQRVGRILSDAGMVSNEDIGEALSIQQKLRTRRVGEILTETTDVKQENIEKTMADHAARDKTFSSNARIGDILVATGLVSRDQVDIALAAQKRGKGKKIGAIFIEMGLITEEQLLQALAAKFRLRMVDLRQETPSAATLKILSKKMVDRFKVFPIQSADRMLVVATSTPTDPSITDRLRFITNRNVELVVATESQIEEAINKFYDIENTQIVDKLVGKMGGEQTVVTEDDPSEESVSVEPDSEVIIFINQVLIDAYKKGSSDIHFEPGMGKEPFIIRYRVDGECYIAHQIPYIHKAAIISRLKIMSELDIAEKRRPQSGKIMLRYEGRRIEYRLEVTPTIGNQEDAVLRILAASKPLALNEMGFSTTNLDRFKEIINRPYGIILCVGPTGSGKTTSLHSALGHINTPGRKIWTAEDPVEITQKGLRQVQVHPKIGFNFAEALRSFLRSDPDVIMIGEMRDQETAKIAIEASLTGHLVFSTLHTNSAPETAVRLIEMGMDPFNFSDALLGILAQRLARTLCDNCKKPYLPDRKEYEEMIHGYGKERFAEHKMPDYSPELSFMKKQGCEKCGGSGYKGRVAFHELLIATGNVKEALKKSMDAEHLKELAIDEGMRTLRMDGISKVFQGITDYDQVNKVCL